MADSWWLGVFCDSRKPVRVGAWQSAKSFVQTWCWEGGGGARNYDWNLPSPDRWRRRKLHTLTSTSAIDKPNRHARIQAMQNWSNKTVRHNNYRFLVGWRLVDTGKTPGVFWITLQNVSYTVMEIETRFFFPLLQIPFVSCKTAYSTWRISPIDWLETGQFRKQVYKIVSMNLRQREGHRSSIRFGDTRCN